MLIRSGAGAVLASITCTSVLIVEVIKLYNSSMGGVEKRISTHPIVPEFHIHANEQFVSCSTLYWLLARVHTRC